MRAHGGWVVLCLGLACCAIVSGHNGAPQNADRADLASPSNTRLAVQAILAGGLASRVHERTVEEHTAAQRLKIVAKDVERDAKHAAHAAAVAKQARDRQRLKEHQQDAAKLIEVMKNKNTRQLEDSKEAAFKKTLLSQMHAMLLTAVSNEQKLLVQGHALDANLTAVIASANQTRDQDAKVGAKLEAAKKKEQEHQQLVKQLTENLLQGKKRAGESGEAVQVLQEKLQVYAKEGDNAGVENIPKDVAKEDVWGTEKCSQWISQDPKKCEAANYGFNCAKTCAEKAAESSAGGATSKAALMQQHASAVAKAATDKGALKDAESVLHKQQERLNAAQTVEKMLLEKRTETAVAEKKDKKDVQRLLQKAKDMKASIAAAANAHARIASFCNLLRDVHYATAATLAARQEEIQRSDLDDERRSVELKALNTGLLIIGDVNHTTLIQPHNATNTQLKSPLLLDDEWGTEKCKAWIAQDTERCQSENYQMRCAKSCMEQAHKILSVPQKAAAKSQAKAWEALQNAARHNTGTSNSILERAYKILQGASQSVTKLFNLHKALGVSTKTPDQKRRSRILNERYQKASSTAKAQAASAKTAETRARDAHIKALKLARDTSNVVTDQGVIDSAGLKEQGMEQGINDRVKPFLSKSSDHKLDSPSSPSFVAELNNIRKAEGVVEPSKHLSKVRHTVRQHLHGQASVLIPYYCSRPQYKRLCKFYKSLKRRGHLSQPI